MSVTPPRPSGRRRWLWALLLLPLLLLLSLPLLIDAESFRGKIEQALSDASGWQADLGEIELSVWQGLKLTVQPVTLVDPEGEGLFAAESIRVGAAWGPLLRGELKIDSVEVLAPQIRLVRLDEEGGWRMPLAGSPDAPASSTSAPPSVSIGSIVVRDGRFEADDRSVVPVRRLELNQLRLELRPAEGSIEGSGRLDPGAGELRFDGSIGGAMTLELERIAADAIRPWLGEELLHPGGELSGTVEIDLPASIRGTLNGNGLRLLAGAEPLPDVELNFDIGAQPAGWSAERIVFRSNDVELLATGDLLPLQLDVELPATELGSALAFTDAVLPLGLDLEAPGSVGVKARLSAAADGALIYQARGAVEAAVFHVAEILPPIEEVRGSFALSPTGELELTIEQAQVGGGPLSGVVRIDSIEPLGKLTFTGGLESAAFGSLMAGLIPDAEKRIQGLAAFSGNVSVKLSDPEITAGSLGGRLAFDAQGLRVKGLDLEAALREAVEKKLGGLTSLAGKLGIAPESEPAGAPKTQRLLDSLKTDVEFESLPWPLPSVRLTSGELTAEGGGSFDPLTGEIDLMMTALIDAEHSAEYVARSSALRGTLDESGRIRLPMQLRGPMTAPGVKFDLSKLMPEKETRAKAKSLIEGLLKKR